MRRRSLTREVDVREPAPLDVIMDELGAESGERAVELVCALKENLVQVRRQLVIQERFLASLGWDFRTAESACIFPNGVRRTGTA